jgi:hypothetical protein
MQECFPRVMAPTHGDLIVPEACFCVLTATKVEYLLSACDKSEQHIYAWCVLYPDTSYAMHVCMEAQATQCNHWIAFSCPRRVGPWSCRSRVVVRSRSYLQAIQPQLTCDVAISGVPAPQPLCFSHARLLPPSSRMLLLF